MSALSYGTAKDGTVLASKLASIPAGLLVVQAPGVRATPALYTAPPPTRDADGTLHYTGGTDAARFTPNLTPEEVLRRGSFGGTYFRNIASGVTGKVHVDAWKELPPGWLAGLDVKAMVAAPAYSTQVNTYGVSSGQKLRDWEGSNWITAQDPFGW